MKMPGLLQNYEVMLLFVLLLMMAHPQLGDEALSVDAHSDAPGGGLDDAAPTEVQLIGKTAVFEGKNYHSPSDLIRALEERHIYSVALSPATDISYDKLLHWLTPISAHGVSIQLKVQDGK